MENKSYVNRYSSSLSIHVLAAIIYAYPYFLIKTFKVRRQSIELAYMYSARLAPNNP